MNKVPAGPTEEEVADAIESLHSAHINLMVNIIQRLHPDHPLMPFLKIVEIQLRSGLAHLGREVEE